MEELLQQLIELNDKYLDLIAENESLIKEIFKLQMALMIEREKKIIEKSHKEVIVCPGCDNECKATVIHTVPFFTYIHNCNNCDYVITESDWNVKS
jgi:ribosomal protein L37AE/L43A